MQILQTIRRHVIRWLDDDQVDHTAGLEVVFGPTESQTINQPEVSLTVEQMNGRIRTRLRYLFAVGVIIIVVFAVQLWQIQVDRGQALALEGQYNKLTDRPLFAARGTITDRNGKRIGWSEQSSSTPFYDRHYATSSGLGHVLGYVSYPQADDQGKYFRKQTVGKAGVEAGFDDYLSAEPGRKIFTTNAAQQVVSESVVTPPQPGADLQISIDTQLQNKLHSLIEQTAEEREYEAGVGVIMDTRTGELLTAVSFPDFKPNKITENRSYLNKLQATSSAPFLNRISEGLFTPGSVVKPFMAVGALNENVVTPQTTIVSKGQMRVPNPYEPNDYTIFTDWKAHGPVNMREAIAVSSNIYFYQIGGGFQSQDGLGIDNIAKYSRGFGLAQKTGIRAWNESRGIIPGPEWKQRNFADGVWRVGDTYNTVIGQYGFQVTPLQILRATAGIATGGRLPTPSLRTENQPADDAVTPDISDANYAVVRDGMRQAVASSKGTAHNLDTDFVDVAAKTGTAELGGEKPGINSWVTGYYPSGSPRYAFTVVMAEGERSNVVGGLFVMRRLLEWMQTNKPQYLSAD